jgi:hypothetical protein
MVDKNQTTGGRKRRHNQNVVSFWLDEADYERLTQVALIHGGDRKKAFLDLLYRRHRPAFPILAALGSVIAASLALVEDGADDTQLQKLRHEVDHLARLALIEVRATHDEPE